MIRFEHIERQATTLNASFIGAKPFPWLAIDDFCDISRLRELEGAVPDPVEAGINKSRDYVFARNKFEKSEFRTLGTDFAELYEDLVSERFQRLVQRITGEDVFIDPAFHGGGIHQGGDGSYLDMHADFNMHPERANWFRNLNILLYLNRDWRPEYGGHLKLRHRESGEHAEIEPLFNRCVIMHTRAHTLHGYDRIHFPPGRYRRSIAAYAYTLVQERSAEARSTIWYPEDANLSKRWLGLAWPRLVAIKRRFFGSRTAQNR
jgi:hypothetical protein